MEVPPGFPGGTSIGIWPMEGVALDARTRVLIIVVLTLISVIAGMVAALLKRASGSAVPEVLLYGFGAFGAALGLALAVIAAYRSLG
jgi:hypothetical protein